MKKLLQSTLLAAAALAFTAAAASAVEVGKPAPDFTLTDIDGKTHKLSQYAGKVVVLEWVNHGCPYVVKCYDGEKMPQLQKQYTGKDVVWLSICSSAPGTQGHMSAADWKATNAKKGFAGTAVLVDESGKVGKLYAAKTTPHMFVIDKKGTLVYDGAIDDKPTSKIADLATAQNYVAAAVDAVLAGKPVAVSTSKPYGCSVKYAKDS